MPNIFLFFRFPLALRFVAGRLGGSVRFLATLRLVLAMSRYCDLFPGLCFFGDNIASLQLALSGRAKGEMGALARELFIRRVRGDWKYTVGHLPSEHNILADTPSRLHEPGSSNKSPVELLGSSEVLVPSLASLWST